MATSRSAAFAHLLGLVRPAGATAKGAHRRPPITDWQAEKSASSPAAREEAEHDREYDELNGSSLAATARRRERARCAAIFASPHANANFSLAAALAFDTTLTAREVATFLASQSTRPATRTATAGGPVGPHAVLKSWGQAFDTARQMQVH